MYKEAIRIEAAKRGFIGKYNPRHIEAYMRLEHSTLDGLSPKQFSDEIGIAMECINVDGAGNAEKLAQSFGL